MTTPNTTIITLSVLTLVFIVVLSNYQLITSDKKRPETNGSFSPAPVLHQTMGNTTVTPAGTVIRPKKKHVTHSYDRFERTNFADSLTHTDSRWKLAHSAWTKSCGHFQFDYVINSAETCRRQLESSPVFLLNYVHSAVDNFARRARVRASWANRSNYLDERTETLFFVGLPSGDRWLATQAAVEDECRQFGDIVQVNIVDSYR